MESIDRLRLLAVKIWSLVAIIILVTGDSAYALRMTKWPTKWPEHLQSVTAEPQMRSISLKLPLRQPVFHWTFMNREEFLAGKLVLRITRNGKTAEIVIFENGQMLPGWGPMSLSSSPKKGEVYFGFLSSKKYATAPNDQLEIELHVKKDLSGIGPRQRGILPAGTYKAKGTYSGLIDKLNYAPKETIDKWRQALEFRAFLENWQNQWALHITSDEGWLSPEEQQQLKKLLKKQLEQMQREKEATKN